MELLDADDLRGDASTVTARTADDLALVFVLAAWDPTLLLAVVAGLPDRDAANLGVVDPVAHQ
jgi:hypothetical protein